MSDIINQKKIFAQNLKYYLKQHGKSQSEFAQELGFPTGTVSDWVTAKKYPRVDKIQLIADYFGIYKSNLSEMLVDQENHKRPTQIPVLGSVIAGIPVEAFQEVESYEEISESLARTGTFFALRVKGDSMEPKMEAGDIVVVKQQASVDSGQYGIALVGEQDATLKQIKNTSKGIMLISLNTKYDPIIYDKEEIETLPVRIIGRVIELRKKL